MHLRMGFMGILFLAFASVQAFPFSCSEDCGESCRVSVAGFGGVEPDCYAGCKVWHAAQCWNLSNPYVSAMGEFGSNAYPLSAGVMKTRNPISTQLDEHEKKVLRPFYGNLVDNVRLHLKSGMMDQWGDPPMSVDLGNSSGQTFGDDVYIRYFRTELDRVDRVVLIGHEMCHTRQYYQRNQSFQKFGRDYFEGYAHDGGYRSNRMEEECYGMEDKIRAAAETYFAWFDQFKRPWNLDVCNDSGFDSIYVAYGYPHKSDGLTLVPAPFVKGWYEVKKGHCQRILTNIKSDDGVDAFATAGAGGNWATWGGGGGNEYCIDPINAFETGYRTQCNRRKLESVAFQTMENPWRTGAGNGTYTWRLSGTPTILRACNHTGQRIWGVLSFVEGGRWMARGWYEFTHTQCRDWNLGVYNGNVYLFAESDGAQRVWQDLSKPAFCKYEGIKFDVVHSAPCGPGGSVAHPYEFKVNAGLNTWAFNP